MRHDQHHKINVIDSLWHDVRSQAEEIVRREPELATFLHATILNQDSLERAIIFRIAQRLDHEDLPASVIAHAFNDALSTDKSITAALRLDLAAVLERDPATTRLIEPLLYYKGFHAIQTHRLAHWLWHNGRKDFALYLQSRSSAIFQTDIHPAAKFGHAIFLDHATGLVVGSTATLGNDVSILQNVTLGGTGKERGDRHPKIGNGVLIGAGSKILGNISVGHCARIAAGSVVLKEVPPCTTVAGVPAKVIGDNGCAEPSRGMDQVGFDPGI